MKTAIITFENAPVTVEIVKVTKDEKRFLARTLEGKQIGWFDTTEIVLNEEQISDMNIAMELGYGHGGEQATEAGLVEEPAKDDHKLPRGQRIASVAFLLQTTKLTDKEIMAETGVNQKFVSNVRCMIKYPKKYTMITKHLIELPNDMKPGEKALDGDKLNDEPSETTETKSEE